MKKNVFLMAMIAIALVSCKDNAEVRSAMGTYSYKTSGTITIDTLTNVAISEQGAMDVVSLKNGNSVLVTFNQLLGDAYATHASIQNDSITLQPFTRLFSHVNFVNPITILVQGAGRVYDGTIIIYMSYQGLNADSSIVVYAPQMRCIAKKN